MIKEYLKYFAISALLLFIQTSCSTSDGLSKSERRALIASRVAHSISDRHFTIDVNTANPVAFPTVILQSPFSLTLNGDTLVSYLPYFGTSYFAVPYGGGNPLNFTSTISNYETTLLKRGEHLIRFTARNGEEIFNFSINIFDNGRASIFVLSRNRSDISFNGEMKME